ncbi:aminotransferase class I/II-fold pyridoxal phosphate-dependent enzyme [Rheinheimera metallidurans]|uniref:aminotransferase class I/II-fold pyridoxal phosphate-dependent enzyme n=1 Tax=Rheinheimera metallidurans TaxID=2925781 RepID=UPI0030024B9F
MFVKKSVDDLAVFSGSPLFNDFKSTSSLYQPALSSFLQYSKAFFDNRHYTNNGPNVKLLEKRLAEFHQTKYCITFSNGFWAIVLAMKELALAGKTEVLMPSFTYRRMADIAAWVGLKPRFCEVSPDTLAATYDTAKPYINEQTALILAVHPIVNCCDVTGLQQLGIEYGIPVLFDAVESMYETIAEGKIGSFGNAECFSMHASKLLNGCEGGYVTTNDEELAHKLRLKRSFGFAGQDNCIAGGGLNAKLNELHATMALANLDELPQLVVANKKRYDLYKTLLSAVTGVRLLQFDERYQTSFKTIIVELTNDWPFSRDKTIELLNAERILARSYYSPALHQKKMLYPACSADLPLTDYLCTRFMLLPCGDFIGANDISQVVMLLQFLRDNADQIKSLQLSEANHDSN